MGLLAILSRVCRNTTEDTGDAEGASSAVMVTFFVPRVSRTPSGWVSFERPLKEDTQMKRHVVVALLLLAAAASLAAQTPKGWRVRIDRSTSASDPDAAGSVKFVSSGSGFHATNPQAAVYWNPTNTAAGTYTIKGTFTLVKPSNHTNYYGLVFGGSDLEGPKQSYLYFVVAQDGTWLLKRRDGDDTKEVSDKSVSDAVKKPDASGKSTNALEVRVSGNTIDYVVNGTKVHSTPKTGATAKTDGIYGIRVNHMLEVQVDGLTVAKQ